MIPYTKFFVLVFFPLGCMLTGILALVAPKFLSETGGHFVAANSFQKVHAYHPDYHQHAEINMYSFYFLKNHCPLHLIQ
jgi:hypothetical protein